MDISNQIDQLKTQRKKLEDDIKSINTKLEKFEIMIMKDMIKDKLRLDFEDTEFNDYIDDFNLYIVQKEDDRLYIDFQIFDEECHMDYMNTNNNIYVNFTLGSCLEVNLNNEMDNYNKLEELKMDVDRETLEYFITILVQLLDDENEYIYTVLMHYLEDD